MLDQRQGAALGDGDDGQAGGLGLEDDLAEGVGGGGEGRSAGMVAVRW